MKKRVVELAQLAFRADTVALVAYRENPPPEVGKANPLESHMLRIMMENGKSIEFRGTEKEVRQAYKDILKAIAGRRVTKCLSG